MIEVTMVSVLNLDRLYKACVDKQNDSYEFVPMFKQYTHMLYNNVSISIQIKNLNLYEAYMLRTFATSVTTFTNMHVDYSDIEYTPAERNLIELYKKIQEDKKISAITRSDFPYYYGPAKFIKVDTCATFSGYNLISLFGDPTDFFLKLSAGACSNTDDDGHITFKPEYVLNDSAVGSFIANTFYNKFYSFIINGFTSTDIYSARGIHSYFSIKHEEFEAGPGKFNVKLAAIINPYLKINIFNGSDMMNNNIAEFKESAPDNIKAGILDNTELEFYICSSFDTLIDISGLIPFSMIKCIEHPADVMVGNPEVYSYDRIHISKDYDESITSLSKRVVEESLALINSNNPAEKKDWSAIASSTFLNSKVSYTIHVSLTEINLYINTALKNNSGMKKATRGILEFILNASIAVYNKLK